MVGEAADAQLHSMAGRRSELVVGDVAGYYTALGVRLYPAATPTRSNAPFAVTRGAAVGSSRRADAGSAGNVAQAAAPTGLRRISPAAQISRLGGCCDDLGWRTTSSDTGSLGDDGGSP